MNTLLHLGAISMPGPMEWMIIAFIALIVFGPKRLPELARAVGESVNSFKDGMSKKVPPADAASQREVGGPSAPAAALESRPAATAAPAAAEATSERHPDAAS